MEVGVCSSKNMPSLSLFLWFSNIVEVGIGSSKIRPSLSSFLWFSNIFLNKVLKTSSIFSLFLADTSKKEALYDLALFSPIL